MTSLVVTVTHDANGKCIAACRQLELQAHGKSPADALDMLRTLIQLSQDYPGNAPLDRDTQLVVHDAVGVVDSQPLFPTAAAPARTVR